MLRLAAPSSTSASATTHCSGLTRAPEPHPHRVNFNYRQYKMQQQEQGR